MSKIHGEFSVKFKDLCQELNNFRLDTISKTNKMVSLMSYILHFVYKYGLSPVKLRRYVYNLEIMFLTINWFNLNWSWFLHLN